MQNKPKTNPFLSLWPRCALWQEITKQSQLSSFSIKNQWLPKKQTQNKSIFFSVALCTALWQAFTKQSQIRQPIPTLDITDLVA
jgi:hypothetical protein